MAALSFRKFKVTATIQKPCGAQEFIDKVVSFTDPWAVWSWLRSLADVHDGDLIANKIHALDVDTGEVKKPDWGAATRALAPAAPAVPAVVRKPWPQARDSFGLVIVEVETAPCTYKETEL